MTEVVGVRFKRAGIIYYFDPNGISASRGMPVIVETARGIEYGIVDVTNKMIPEEEIIFPLKKIIRAATDEDCEQKEKNHAREKEAVSIFEEKVKKHGLEMKLIDVELTFDLNKIIFYYTADGRVDFRELVKDLASIFRMRIELKQIGPRDETKIMNGLAICGRPLCCATFLTEFQPVSVKMAKEQNLPLNPTKISGICGRLMCCLKYEEDTYGYLNKNLPKEGDTIKTPDGIGEVLSVIILRQLVKVAVRKRPQDEPVVNLYPVSDISIVKSRKVEPSEQNLSELDKLQG